MGRNFASISAVHSSAINLPHIFIQRESIRRASTRIEFNATSASDDNTRNGHRCVCAVDDHGVAVRALDNTLIHATLDQRGAAAATNGGTLPNTTPDQPYLTDFLVRDFPRLTKRKSAGATFDWKLGRADRVSVIDADELARELEVIIQEAKRKRDTASAVTLGRLS